MLLLCSALLMAVFATADPITNPQMVGSLSTLAHGVSGDLYVVDEKTLMLKNFNYDGAGPDAFFWVGTEGSPADPKNESKTAILAHPFKDIHYEYRNDEAPILKAATQETITLTLPPHLQVSDLKWFSVWCRLYAKDFGNLMIPTDFKIADASAEPEPATVPEPETVPEPVPETSPEPVPESTPEPVPEIAPESVKKEELPSPVIINNAVDEPQAEPETEPESVPEGHDHSHEDEDSPNSLESKSEPEPKSEPGSAPNMVSGLMSLVTVLFLSSLVY